MAHKDLFGAKEPLYIRTLQRNKNLGACLYRGPAETVGRSADQLIIFQMEGADYVHQITT